MAPRKDDDMPEAHKLADPVDQFRHLNPELRRRLGSLGKDEADAFGELLRLYLSARAIGKFGKWAFLTAVALFIVGAQFGDAVLKFLHWFTGGKG